VKFRFVIALISLSLITPTASAAIKVVASKSPITAISPAGSGDQIFDIAINSTGVAIVGTVETGALELTPTPTLGGSDGFISLVDKSKVRIWDLRLGTGNDDIATAVARDKSGNFWVVGSTSKPLEPTAVNSVDPTIINLDNVLVDPVSTPANSLTRLLAWKVSPSGQLLGTYFYDADGVIVPTQITVKLSGFSVVGELTKEAVTSKFQIDLDAAGIFTNLADLKPIATKAPAIATIKAGANNLKSFISKTTIIGIPSWRAKAPTPVVIKYTKNGKALAANSFSGKVTKVLWQSGVGAAVLVDAKGELELHILSNMA